MKRIYAAGLAVLFSIQLSAAQHRPEHRPAEEHRRLMRSAETAFTLEIEPRFIGASEDFWYAFRTGDGLAYYLVEPQKKRQTRLFDTAELAVRIGELRGRPCRAAELDIQPEFAAAGDTFRFRHDGQEFVYHLRRGALEMAAEPPAQAVADKNTGAFSPDSAYVMFVREHDLYVAGNPARGGDTTAVRLTSDGERNRSFAREGEQGCVARWFRRGTGFYALREDSRHVADLWVVDAMAQPRPALRQWKAPLVADTAVVQYELLIGDADSREVRTVDIARWPNQWVETLYDSDDGERLYFRRSKRTRDESEICMVSAKTGEVAVLIRETGYISPDPQMQEVHFLDDGREILLRSERSGRGHYYLYDEAGNLIRTITSGAWTAGAVQRIDTARRQLYIECYGREKGIYPNYPLLYRISMDNPDHIALLTPENAAHRTVVSPRCGFVVDSYSRVDSPTRNVLRNRNGKIIMRLNAPDLQRIEEAGWRPPERFVVKAADGTTDLYGVMWKPAAFDPDARYPVISSVCIESERADVPIRFSCRDDFNSRLAQLGFIVVAVGHRGDSPLRGQDYMATPCDNPLEYALADDAHALRQLADRYGFIDLDRAGIVGHGAQGGAIAAAALLTYPELYKAAVASAGAHDPSIATQREFEHRFGAEEVATEQDSTGVQKPQIVVRAPKSAELAENYRGGLLLATGDMDTIVHPAHTLPLAQALIDAGKRFDMIVLPATGHEYGGAAAELFERKTWNHFLRFLKEK
ncbi:S9 family peptidase [Alistipes sp. OttesenSCG-928-B03]|nr:S9 family peptidase [Alistipes sp. OttesenSCG-928-B03]